MTVNIFLADYNNIQQAQDLITLLNAYAQDPMGGGEELSQAVKLNLVKSMSKRQDMFTILCYVDDKPAGLINCIEGFSTFNCQPVMNIHDVIVLPEYRGMGLSSKMLTEVEALASFRGCCKLTLEVLTGNEIAKKSYQKFGFAGYELDPKLGQAMFWEKKIK
ncbi:MAG: GNAT family N-acetyltransferase [Gammaproteobacteria bacterium]|nr:MAG: GNAT family N-acetyltransferase [Gammaproteobacteria bacterium]